MAKKKIQGPKIKYIIRCLYSERDVYGNCYWAMQVTDTLTGERCFGTVSGGDSNIRCLKHEMGLEWDELYFYIEAMQKRAFFKLTKDWPHAGCTGEELISFVHKNLGKQE
jgi:hypothetical protein